MVDNWENHTRFTTGGRGIGQCGNLRSWFFFNNIMILFVFEEALPALISLDILLLLNQGTAIFVLGVLYLRSGSLHPENTPTGCLTQPSLMMQMIFLSFF
jgi:hypothetical protein